MSSIRIAYIGCGAVVERSHLPAISDKEEFTVTTLIDRNKQQLMRLAEENNVSHLSDDFNEVIDQFDLAVIATPSASHAVLGMDLLRAGKHVLMEKPLATSVSEAQQLTSLAEANQLLLAVSLVRRYSPHFQLLKQILEGGLLGEIKEFCLEEGGVFNWPVQSVDFYSAQKSGGGVLIDHGAHLLDACLWWFGDYQSVSYADDSRGGVEADCELQLKMINGASGVVRMSRVRQLKNRLKVTGSIAQLEMNLGTGIFHLTPINPTDRALTLFGEASNVEDKSQVLKLDTVELFSKQYEGIAAHLAQASNVKSDSLSTAETPDIVLAADAQRSIELIERCYKERHSQPLVAW